MALTIATSSCTAPPRPQTQPDATDRPGILPLPTSQQDRPAREAIQDLAESESIGADLEQKVIEVLRQGDRDTARLLAERLAHEPRNVMHDAIVRALGQAPIRPRSAFVPVLLRRLSEFASDGGPGADEVAAALGRCLDESTVEQVIARARKRQTPIEHRTVLIESLGYYRDKDSAGALVQLTGADQPPRVRQAAASALARLTGDDQLALDYADWQRWYQRREHLPRQDWLQSLIEDMERRGRARVAEIQRQMDARLSQAELNVETASQQLKTISDQLIDVQYRFYRATEVEKRSDLLVTWLSEGPPESRGLAVRLAKQRLTANRPFDEPLRAALRARLDDEAADIRREVALLLWNLSDMPAADWVAQRLPSGEEADTGVIKAYLLLMGRLPRAAAVEPALSMLVDPSLRPEAAGALAAAIDEKLLSHEQLAQAAARVRDQFRGDELPKPELVTLLARVADDGDWLRIARWLDAEDEIVKEAAAKAWARSDRPLLELARRAGDEHIQQIVLRAVRERGSDPATLFSLIDHRPTGEQMVEPWRHALLAMAPRVPLETVLLAERKLSGQDETGDLREHLLSAAIGPLIDSAASPTQSDRQVLVALLIRRAELRQSAGKHKAALTDLFQIGKLNDVELDDAHRRLMSFIRLRAHLALGEDDSASQAARSILETEPKDQTGEVKVQIADVFLETAERRIAAKQLDGAVALLAGLRRLLNPAIPEQLERRISDLEHRADTIGRPPAPAADATAQDNKEQ